MRTATSADLPAIRRVLAEAFVEDPMVPWIFPDGEHRLEATAAWLGLFAEHYVHHGRADVAEVGDGVLAVALWRWPDQLPSAAAGLPTIRGLLAALVGRERATVLTDALRTMATVTPPAPFVYLHFLAVDPSHQRRGLGRRVLERGLAAAEAGGHGVHLDTTNPDNLAFYRSLGFAVTGHLRFDFGGPELWGLCARRAEPRETRRDSVRDVGL